MPTDLHPYQAHAPVRWPKIDGFTIFVTVLAVLLIVVAGVPASTDAEIGATVIEPASP